MKSRKPAKASSQTRRADRYRKQLRSSLRSFETLEERRLLTVAPWSNGMYYPPIGASTAFLAPGTSAAQYAAISSQQYGGVSPAHSQLQGEGIQPFINTTEAEPNDVYSQATYVNLGTLDSKSDGVAIVGSLSAPVIPGTPFKADTDYFAFDLRAGDIFDAQVKGLPASIFDLSILDANRQEVIGNDGPTGFLGRSNYPLGSPLDVTASNPNVDLAFVVPTTGRYYARVSDGDSPYTLTLRVRRPELETTPVGTKQKIFLDFDGEILRRDIFETPGTARLSPMSEFLTGWGLTAADESRMIDKIIDVFKSKFFGSSSVWDLGGNGWYSVTGVAGQFDLEILNSRDNPDAFGQPNVSRIIFGGTQAQLNIDTIGIAQSIDVGNFDTEETAVVLLDLIEPLWGIIPRAGNVPLEDVLAAAIGAVGVHEAGHFFGAWHTLNGNASNQIMDTGGNLDGLIGVGTDGIFGTADDRNVQFGTDTYDPFASAIPYGKQNSTAAVAFGLATGTVGGATIKGNVYQDNNLNRLRDAGDLPMASVAIYVDANNNGLLDTNEQRVFSDASGNYQMTVAPGYYVLREYVPAGYKQVVPVGNAHGVGVSAGQTVTGKDFINERANASISGIKWNDLNGNGVRDNGEPAIPGVYIYVDLDGDDRLDIGEPTARTNTDGSFKLNFPGVGVYTVREVAEAGFTQTYPGPAYNNEHTIYLSGDPVVDAPRVSALHFGNRVTVDYGDAPASYGVASSGFLNGLTLGTQWDAEAVSQFSNDALGDDSNGVIDDEDAIDTAGAIPRLRVGSNNPITITATNSTGQPAYLQAWVDFNANGIFDANEQVAVNVPVNGTGTFTAALPLLAGATLGNTFARLRLSTTQNVPATGPSANGEVEDYLVTIVPDQLAVSDTVTVGRNNVLVPIDVLGNDFKALGETLEVINVSQGSRGGLVTFTATGVLYTPPAGYIGQETFTYQMRNAAGETGTATVTVDVKLFFANPLAIDDSFEVPTDAIDFPLNVLANDIEGQNGALSIISVTQPDKGGSLSIATGNKSLRYTPSRTFGGTEFFIYTVSDAAGQTSIAKGTLHTLPGDRANDKLQIRLVATDTAGNPISRIQQNQEFRIDMYVDDLRFNVNADPLDPNNNPSPDLSAGVFAAYTDLLYNLQLVSTVLPTAATPSGFNFAVSFFNNYLNGERGDATIPGIVDELGAFFDGSNMNRPNEVRMASVTFKAKTPGIANFLADPADIVPASNSLLFDTSATAVPIDQIRYLGTSLEIVADGVVFPVAVDDSTGAIPVGVAFPINVLANDLPGSSGPITLKPNGFTAPLHGAVGIVGSQVVYTPNLGYTGSDQFTYTIVDTQGNESIGRVTVKVGTNTAADDIVALPLQVTDLTGAPITQIAVGQQFQLRGYVQDVRTTGTRLGVFAAYQDVIYSAGLASPVASGTNNLGFEVTFGPQYTRVKEGDILTRGVLNEIGAVATSDSDVSYGVDPHLLFIVTLTAQATGVATFVGDPADISPLHDTLTFQPVLPVGYDKVTYGLATITIINGTTTLVGGEFTNNINPLDVNADGYVSPIDALAIINALNTGGARSLLDSLGGEGEAGNRFFIDTNGDNLLTPMDVLNVINFLNANSSGRLSGEGEASSSVGSIAASDAVYSDELFDDGVDELIGQLAPQIEQSWKKKA